MASSLHHIAILGCGVIGLSTALAILEDQPQTGRGSRSFVTIVSKEVPNLDEDSGGAGQSSSKKPSAEYASLWAGGHHVSDAKSERELRYDKITFERMSLLAREKPWSKKAAVTSGLSSSSVLPVPPAQTSNDAEKQAEPLVWVHQTELYEKADGPQIAARPPYEGVLDWYPDFKPLPQFSLKGGLSHGCTFSTIDINVPVYHRWLLHCFLELGGRLVVAEAKSLRQAVQLATSPASSQVVCKDIATWRQAGKVDALVASPGLGARFIEGIKDEAVHPQRGQVVVVHAPWLSADAPSWNDKPPHKLPGYSIVRAQGGREVYVIPRGDGTVVCGGTRIVDDWDPNPRPDTTKRILERCLGLVPQLADPKKSAGLTRPRAEDVQVVGVNVGLRPARRGGPRLDRAMDDVDGVKVVYNYGYGGAGYQASWGAALDAKQLVEEALQIPSSSSVQRRSAKL
ncbi:FAD dependent oxidoreductase [Kalmanozyma brasiliensis GHG001]|uniref:FAD dependent oxidoreductase domain-containing protein n=1 Tax=Kalmanozyma brasiliensis (strain GHG001) TaxID=1365824 RepID=V5EVJ4_KALBG|nr:FAD dependent oxidoreductase [Kalmanozyma brasiliensis GHG001]EST06249.1 FAD dependent oxidoreductase [Kalmanozyma brasiliensis GHG001]